MNASEGMHCKRWVEKGGGEKDTRKKMVARGEGLEVARETWGIAEVFSVFTYKELNVGRGMLGWTGLPVVG